MNYVDKSTYLTYSFWNGEYRKAINLNPRELTSYTIQQIINDYVFSREDELKELKTENKRMSKLLDSILNENANFKRVLEQYREVNSGY